jgi:hypothetical protein
MACEIGVEDMNQYGGMAEGMIGYTTHWFDRKVFLFGDPLLLLLLLLEEGEGCSLANQSTFPSPDVNS